MDLATSERFTKLWVHAQGTVATFISTMRPEVHRAEDILQNVAIAALRKFNQFDETRSFQAWVLGIACCEILQARRAGARNPILSDTT